jgi:hypothetical protein
MLGEVLVFTQKNNNNMSEYIHKGVKRILIFENVYYHLRVVRNFLPSHLLSRNIKIENTQIYLYCGL